MKTLWYYLEILLTDSANLHEDSAILSMCSANIQINSSIELKIQRFQQNFSEKNPYHNFKKNPLFNKRIFNSLFYSYFCLRIKEMAITHIKMKF